MRPAVVLLHETQDDSVGRGADLGADAADAGGVRNPQHHAHGEVRAERFQYAPRTSGLIRLSGAALNQMNDA